MQIKLKENEVPNSLLLLEKNSTSLIELMKRRGSISIALPSPMNIIDGSESDSFESSLTTPLSPLSNQLSQVRDKIMSKFDVDKFNFDFYDLFYTYRNLESFKAFEQLRIKQLH